MQNVKNYNEDISSISCIHESVFFDNDIKTSLKSMTELILKVFDATACSIVVNSSENPVELCQCGLKINLTEDDLLGETHNTTVINNTRHTTLPDPLNTHTLALRVVAPIFLPSNFKFGWVAIERQVDLPFTKKDTLILNTILENIVNQLMQHLRTFEIAKEIKRHSMISKLNKDFIFIKDEHFKFVYVNEAFKSGYPREMQDKIIGFTTIEGYDEAEANTFLAQDKIALDCGISKVVESVHMPNGSYIIVETIKQRFEDDCGKQYILGVCRDITEKENLITKLKKANSELDEFTSIASHDLKSPLNAIKRLLEWILDDCENLLPQEHLENFRLVVSRTNRMQVLLEDLLSYSKIDCCDSARTQLSLESICSDITDALAIAHTVTINVNANNTLLNIPAFAFKTVIQHLISNAIKHNDKEHSVVTVSLLPCDHYYVIEVTDNGPGINSKYFSLIFKLFQTLRSRDDVEGSGIGLCVAKKHITNYGGKIEVASDGILGSTFTVYWPKK